MHAFLDTAGELLEIDCSLSWVGELIAEGAAGELRDRAGAASVRVRVDEDRHPFDTRGWEVLARGAWRRNDEVIVENACTAGFDLHVSFTSGQAEFTYRWNPPARDRTAARILRSRFHLLARAILLQYPALWWAGTRGRAPLHASACIAGGSTPLLTAPSGVGRSTLVLAELDSGGRATGDNLSVGDGTTVWGLVEPLRLEGGSGRRMPHGRSEVPMQNRVHELAPDSLVVLRRGDGDHPLLSPCTTEAAARSLVTSTYMAGELRRYWAFAATLSAGTGLSPSHPPVRDTAWAFADALPRFQLTLGPKQGARLSELMAGAEVAA